MKEASNITPIEMKEETGYNLFISACVAGVVCSGFSMCHMMMFHAVFSYAFLAVGVACLAGVFLFLYIKKTRFGNRNYSLGERVKLLELRVQGIVGEPV